jgi:hypothetical protein
MFPGGFEDWALGDQLCSKLKKILGKTPVTEDAMLTMDICLSVNIINTAQALKVPSIAII